MQSEEKTRNSKLHHDQRRHRLLPLSDTDSNSCCTCSMPRQRASIGQHWWLVESPIHQRNSNKPDTDFLILLSSTAAIRRCFLACRSLVRYTYVKHHRVKFV